MSVTEVAEVLHVPANRIYQLLKGQRALTADTALRLSQWLGTSAEMWLNLQKLYELRLVEQQAGEKIRKTIARGQAAHVASLPLHLLIGPTLRRGPLLFVVTSVSFRRRAGGLRRKAWCAIRRQRGR
jgi:addiction module HigA family antidote